MKRYITLAFILFTAALFATQPLHRFNFDGDFSDIYDNGVLHEIHTSSSSFSGGNWNWTAGSTPGGGLLLASQMTDNSHYTVRVVFRYNSLNGAWTKIISLAGFTGSANGTFTSDTGVYFAGTHLGFYNLGFDNTVNFSPGVWYDLMVMRNSSGQMQIWCAPLGDQPQLIVSFQDGSGLAIPTRYPNLPGQPCYFGFFYDDSATTAEWTTGGSVALIEVWDDAMVMNAVQNVRISTSDGNTSIQWDALPGATSYVVYASDAPDNLPWSPIGATATTNIAFPVTQNKRFFRVTGVF